MNRNLAIINISPALQFMTSERTCDDRERDLLRNSLLFRELEAERQEVLRHKWIESEKAGYDIGFRRALIDWRIHHRSKWRKARYPIHN